jgi:hypothetical protein
MLQDEFYGRTQQHDDVDFLDDGDHDLFADLHAGNTRLGASTTLSYIPATERQQDLLDSSVLSTGNGSNINHK